MNNSAINPPEKHPVSNAGAGADNKSTKKASHIKYKLTLYASILFGVSFLLMLMSYLVSLRNNAAALEEHKSHTVSARQSIESLQEENAALRIEVEDLKNTSASLKGDLSYSITALAELQAAYDSDMRKARDKLLAIELLLQLSTLYHEKSYDECRLIIDYMEESGLSASLPDTSELSYQPESPKDLYQRISSDLS